MKAMNVSNECEICGKRRVKGINHEKCSKIKQVQGFLKKKTRALKVNHGYDKERILDGMLKGID
jgi:hypothetical protein